MAMDLHDQGVSSFAADWHAIVPPHTRQAVPIYAVPADLKGTIRVRPHVLSTAVAVSADLDGERLV